MTRNILIIEDEFYMAEMMKLRLQSNSFEIEWVENAEAALGLLETKLFDLMLVDIMLPSLNGFELVTRVREKFSADQLPILVVTALGRNEDKAKAFELGANAYLAKPFDGKELVEKVKALLNE